MTVKAIPPQHTFNKARSRQSLLAPRLWPFKSLNVQQAADGSLTFDRAGIQHICQLNNVPEAVFLEPDPDEHAQTDDQTVQEWIREWNSLTPNEQWQLVPGEYGQNREILVFHWYLIHRLFGCIPVKAYESHFMNRVRDLAHEAAGLHMHLHSEDPYHWW